MEDLGPWLSFFGGTRLDLCSKPRMNCWIQPEENAADRILKSREAPGHTGGHLDRCTSTVCFNFCLFYKRWILSELTS